MNKLCPQYRTKLKPRKTRYGIRWSCPVDGCTVAKWNGSTSTPADEETRKARIKAHDAFDPLWKFGRYRRTQLYKKLADFMGLGDKETHIGMFDKEQCARVIEFVEQVK